MKKIISSECNPGLRNPCPVTRRQFIAGLASLGVGATLPRSISWAQEPHTAPTTLFRIDVHHHFSSPGFIAEIASRNTGQLPLQEWTPSKSLEDMDRNGVATSIVSVSEPSVWFGNDAAARRLARECNEYAARLMADHQPTFRAVCHGAATGYRGLPSRDRIRLGYAQGRRNLPDDQLSRQIPGRSYVRSGDGRAQPTQSHRLHTSFQSAMLRQFTSGRRGQWHRVSPTIPRARLRVCYSRARWRASPIYVLSGPTEEAPCRTLLAGWRELHGSFRMD